MRLIIVLSLVLLASTALLLFQFVTGSLIGADGEVAQLWPRRARAAHYRSSTSSAARGASRRRPHRAPSAFPFGSKRTRSYARIGQPS